MRSLQIYAGTEILSCPMRMSTNCVSQQHNNPVHYMQLEMYTAGELLQNVGVTDPASGWVSQILQKVVNLGGLLRPPTQEKLAEDYYIIPVLLKVIVFLFSNQSLILYIIMY